MSEANQYSEALRTSLITRASIDHPETNHKVHKQILPLSDGLIKGLQNELLRRIGELAPESRSYRRTLVRGPVKEVRSEGLTCPPDSILNLPPAFLFFFFFTLLRLCVLKRQ